MSASALPSWSLYCSGYKIGTVEARDAEHAMRIAEHRTHAARIDLDVIQVAPEAS